MSFTRTGLILYVQGYPECVAFYAEALGLEALFSTPELTCFDFGGSYLMVEPDDRGTEGQRSGAESFCLRMNVPNVKARADELRALGIEVDYQEHSWGTVAKFHDPDGNLCAFKDDEKFEQQIAEA